MAVKKELIDGRGFEIMVTGRDALVSNMTIALSVQTTIREGATNIVFNERSLAVVNEALHEYVERIANVLIAEQKVEG